MTSRYHIKHIEQHMYRIFKIILNNNRHNCTVSAFTQNGLSLLLLLRILFVVGLW